MKKIFLSLALSVIAVTACQKPETDYSFSGRAIFTALVESVDSQTKTSMTPEKSVVWLKDDRLAVFQGSTLADEYKVSDTSVGKTNGTFSIVSTNSSLNGDFSAGTEFPCNVAFYPYAEDLSLTGAVLEDAGVVYRIDGVVLPAEQTYMDNSFANGTFPMVAVTENMTDHNLKFKNILGALKLQFKGTQVIKSIRIKGNNNEILSGVASVTAYPDNSVPAISMIATDDASRSVTLNCGDGVQLSTTVSTDFIIALPPVVFTEGFMVTVTDSEDKVCSIKARVTNAIFRSSILAMPEMELGGVLDNIELSTLDYIDEYGINHGSGVEIYGVIWAPVNCGYHATDFKYGKLYQWGRKYGQGYDGTLYDGDFNNIDEYADASAPELTEGPVPVAIGQSEDNADMFFSNSRLPYDWVDVQDDNLWNIGTEDNPVKTEYDPCPTGWRVPTCTEFSELCRRKSEWTTNAENQIGYWFSGAATCLADAPQVFFPAAGHNSSHDGASYHRGCVGEYWVSRPDGVGALSVVFDQFGADAYGNERAFGLSVRCVHESSEIIFPSEDNYIDEYGVNHGRGVKIDETVWAPVNCGYHAADYKWGKLYQWGRKYGQGYSYFSDEYSDATAPEFIVQGPVSLIIGQSENNADLFFSTSKLPYDWVNVQDDNLWNIGTEDNPVKTEYDPCPNGWRVPTSAELNALVKNQSDMTTNADGQVGYWYSGMIDYSEAASQVFFPAAGRHNWGSIHSSSRGVVGVYWSSTPELYYGDACCHESGRDTITSSGRACGYSVRCVHE